MRLNESISHATFHHKHLIEAFSTELKTLDRVMYDKLKKIAKEEGLEGPDEAPIWSSESATFMVDDLIEALETLAPEGYYFGNTEGDGSDFGFWKYD